MLGGRLHYAVPTVLAHDSLLSAFFTDVAIPQWMSGPISKIGKALRWRVAANVARRTPPRIVSPVVPFPGFGFQYWQKVRKARNRKELSSAYLWGGRRFAGLVSARMGRQESGAYTYSTAGLEILLKVNSAGGIGIVEQPSVPRIQEIEYLQIARDLYPYWTEDEFFTTDTDRTFAQREREEWDASSVVVTGSEFAASSLREAGCDPAKIVVIPYGVVLDFSRRARLPLKDQNLKVLFVGKVSLAKGAPLLAHAARELRRDAIDFRAVGSISLPISARRELGDVVTLVGHVPHSKVHDELLTADIFAFPSFSEGSAAVCYEALAAGLPIVTTPNAGSVVRDGVEGFVIASGDAEAFTARIAELAGDEELRRSMSKNARSRATEFTVERYGDRLIRVLESLGC
jgi:glycosyltransferase involved in cell wall biosynthesis